MPEEAIESIRQALGLGGPDDGVWVENVAIVTAFLCVGSQWRVVAVAGLEQARLLYVALDYAAVRAGLDAAGTVVTPDLWSGLQVMEAAARDALNGS